MSKTSTTIDELKVAVGLDISKLNADFLEAGSQVNQALAQLNREKNNINLRGKLEISGLDEVKDKTKIMEIQERTLTQQIKLQEDRIKIVNAEYEKMANEKGKNASATQRLESNLLREQQSLVRLQNALQAVNNTKVEPKIGNANNLLNSYNGLSGKLSTAQMAITNFTSGTNNAVTASLELISKVPTAWGKVAVAAVAATAMLPVAEMGIVKLAEPAIHAGDSLYKLQAKLHATTEETVQFNNIFKLAGISVDTGADALMRLGKSVLTAGENGNEATNMLRRYHVTLTDGVGRLLPYQQQLEQLATGYQRAAKEGNEESYVVATLGARGRELIPILQEYNELKEDSASLVSTGLIDPEEAHEAEREIRKMNYDLGQLKLAFSAALIPVAKEMIPELRDDFAGMINFIKKNKDEIKNMALAFGNVVKAIGTVLGALATLGAKFDEVTGKSKNISGLFGSGHNIAGTIDMGLSAFVGLYSAGSLIEKYYADDINKFNCAEKEKTEAAKKAKEEIEKTKNEEAEAIRKKAAEESKAEEDAAEAQSRIAKNKSEADSIYYHMAHNDTENAIYDIKKQEEEDLKAAKTLEERASIEALAGAKIAKVYHDIAKAEKEKADALNMNTESIYYKMSHSDIEGQINDIELWKQAELEKSQSAEHSAAIIANAEAKEAEAYHNVAKAEQEKANSLNMNTESIYFKMNHTAIESQIHDIEMWKQAELEKSQSAVNTAAIVANAAAKEAEAYKQAADRVKDVNQSLMDDIYKMTHSEKENQLYDMFKRANQAIKDGADKSLVSEWLQDKTNEINKKTKSKDSGVKVVDIDTAGHEHISYGGSTGTSEEEEKYNQAMGIVIPQFKEATNQIVNDLRQQTSQIAGQTSSMLSSMQQLFSDLGENNFAKTGNEKTIKPNVNLTVNVNNPVTVNEKTIQAQVAQGVDEGMSKVASMVNNINKQVNY